MSLINRLLQDLDKRRSRKTGEDVQLPQGTRATTARTRVSRPAVWLIALLVCAVAAALYVWQTQPPLASKAKALLAGLRGTTTAPPPVTSDQPEIMQAEVEAALMIPVFQLSSELASPQGAQLALSADSAGPTALTTRAAARQSTQQAAATNQKAAASITDPKLQSEAGQNAAQRPRKKVNTVAALGGDAKSNAPAARATDANKRSVAGQSGDLERVVIPASLPVSPIEKQTRQLTSYERAVNEFRKGVASLRQGRMSQAEAYFRSAIKEDRSHIASRQALIGILIDAGRYGDAETVLIESLRANPRQPREAMILARLQVESGDLEAAIGSLQSVSAYAGSDAGYYSFLAAVLQRAARHEEAAMQYRNALVLMPRNAVWLMGLGISLKALGDRDGAKEAFRRAASIGTLSPELQAYVVHQYRRLEIAKK